MIKMTLKAFCEKNHLSTETTIDLVVGDGGGILPQRVSFQGYFAEITDTSMFFSNDNLNVRKEIPFSAFQRAEFGIGSAQLWLQCVVDGHSFVFCTTRRKWKSAPAKLILQKIGEQTEVLGMKEYNGYTGKMFIFYLWK